MLKVAALPPSLVVSWVKCRQTLATGRWNSNVDAQKREHPVFLQGLEYLELCCPLVGCYGGGETGSGWLSAFIPASDSGYGGDESGLGN